MFFLSHTKKKDVCGTWTAKAVRAGCAWLQVTGKRALGSVGCPNRMRARTGSLILWNHLHKFIYQPCLALLLLLFLFTQLGSSIELTRYSFSRSQARLRLSPRWIGEFVFPPSLYLAPFQICKLFMYILLRELILGWIMEPMDIVGKSKEDASLPKGFFLIIINFSFVGEFD